MHFNPINIHKSDFRDFISYMSIIISTYYFITNYYPSYKLNCSDFMSMSTLHKFYTGLYIKYHLCYENKQYQRFEFIME